MLSVINSAWIEFDLSIDNCYRASIYLINWSTLSLPIASLSRIHSIIFQSSSSPLGLFIGTIHAKTASSSYFVTDRCTDDHSSKSMLQRVTCYRYSSIQTRLLPISKHQRYQPYHDYIGAFDLRWVIDCDCWFDTGGGRAGGGALHMFTGSHNSYWFDCQERFNSMQLLYGGDVR